MVDIIPAFLPQNIAELEADDSHLPEDVFVHLDMLEEDIWTPLERPFEVHLMVERPEDMIEMWIERGAKRVIAHKFTEEMLGFAGEVELGLALELSVPLTNAEEFLPRIDFVHLMSIAEIGEQDHPLDPKIFDRIKAFQALHPEVIASVDGGITLDNAEELIEAGADRLVIGSHIIKSADPEDAYEDFLSLLK